MRIVQGAAPEWPDGDGPKAFAYLKPFPTLPQLLMQLSQKKIRTLIYPDGIPEKMMKEHASATLRFVDKPLDMRLIGESADFAIHNGNHGTTCELMLAGVPSLVLPLHAEQAIMGRHLQLMSAGLSYVEKTADQFHQGLSALMRDSKYREAAQVFAEKYRGFDRDQATRTALAAVEELLAG
jgi:spore coat polysaccharide biosynthesis predicted glycosyltransferase SpsG